MTSISFATDRQGEIDEACAIVAMTPENYLMLSAGLRDDATPWNASRIREWAEWPYLDIDPETGQVFGHEGCHRITAMLKAGVYRVDVVWRFGVDPARGMSMESMLAWKWDGSIPPIFILKPQSTWLGYK